MNNDIRDEIKTIAVKMLIDTLGENFVRINRDCFSVSYSETDTEYNITFLFSEPVTEPVCEIINNETPIETYVRMIINKSAKKCKIVENTF